MPGLERQRMLEHVAQDGWALHFAAAELQGDREIVLAAVAQAGGALEYAAAELQGDREIVLAAVAQAGGALAYAAAELQGDREFVLAAVAQDGRALQYAAAPLNRHPALQWICSTNIVLYCAKLCLALATCALPTPLSRSGNALSALPRDLIELIGMYILPDVAIHVVARKYRY
jgi:hypothetical protein